MEGVLDNAWDRREQITDSARYPANEVSHHAGEPAQGVVRIIEALTEVVTDVLTNQAYKVDNRPQRYRESNCQ